MKRLRKRANGVFNLILLILVSHGLLRPLVGLSMPYEEQGIAALSIGSILAYSM